MPRSPDRFSELCLSPRSFQRRILSDIPYAFRLATVDDLRAWICLSRSPESAAALTRTMDNVVISTDAILMAGTMAMAMGTAGLSPMEMAKAAVAPHLPEESNQLPVNECGMKLNAEGRLPILKSSSRGPSATR